MSEMPKLRKLEFYEVSMMRINEQMGGPKIIDVEFRVVKDAPELPATTGQATESKGESK